MRKYVYVFEQKCTMICEGKAYKHKSSQACDKVCEAAASKHA